MYVITLLIIWLWLSSPKTALSGVLTELSDQTEKSKFIQDLRSNSAKSGAVQKSELKLHLWTF